MSSLFLHRTYNKRRKSPRRSIFFLFECSNDLKIDHEPHERTKSSQKRALAHKRSITHLEFYFNLDLNLTRSPHFSILDSRTDFREVIFKSRPNVKTTLPYQDLFLYDFKINQDVKLPSWMVFDQILVLVVFVLEVKFVSQLAKAKYEKHFEDQLKTTRPTDSFEYESSCRSRLQRP